MQLYMDHYNEPPVDPPRQIQGGDADGDVHMGFGADDEDLLGMFLDYPSDGEGGNMGLADPYPELLDYMGGV